MFYFEMRFFSGNAVIHDGRKFVENLSKIKKKLQTVSRISVQFINEFRRRTGNVGFTQLSQLRLGEFSFIRFYEIKLLQVRS